MLSAGVPLVGHYLKPVNTMREIPDVHLCTREDTRPMAGQPAADFRSGDALFAFDSDLAIVSWNRAAEELTGVAAEGAIGSFCWEVLAGHDDRGDLVCHPGCSIARLVREGWRVACHSLMIKTHEGRRGVHVSTIAVDDHDPRLFLHVLVPSERGPPPGSRLLTARQQDVLQLLAEGVPAKVIATQLGVVEATVRNHIRAILVALGAHSQLEAIANARRLRLIE
jgi:DNA-binding CsgD family transcriptional regulator